MKKKIINIVVFVAMLACFNVAHSATKYDNIFKTQTFKEVMVFYKDSIAPEMEYVNYLNCAFNRNDISDIIRKGQLDKEKAEFLSNPSNADLFTKFMQAVIMSVLVDKAPNTTNIELVQVVGIIKNDGKIGLAKNSYEAQMEDKFVNMYPSYVIWKNVRNNLVELVNQQMDVLISK